MSYWLLHFKVCYYLSTIVPLTLLGYVVRRLVIIIIIIIIPGGPRTPHNFKEASPAYMGIGFYWDGRVPAHQQNNPSSGAGKSNGDGNAECYAPGSTASQNSYRPDDLGQVLDTVHCCDVTEKARTNRANDGPSAHGDKVTWSRWACMVSLWLESS